VDTYSQDCWTEAQWTQVREAVRDEAKKQRVAASFLPLHGPLSDDAQTVSVQELVPVAPTAPPGTLLEINDFTTRRLTTLSVHVGLRSAQVAEPDLSAALVAFRRAANLIARTEDYLIFQGQRGPALPPSYVQPCSITGGDAFVGLYRRALRFAQVSVPGGPAARPNGPGLVSAVSQAISTLETQGHLGPFALVLGNLLFDTAQDPTQALVLPADRIKPMLDGPLVRSSTLERFMPGALGAPRVPAAAGLLISLGSNLIDLVVGSEIDVQFLQVTPAASPRYVFRVSERFTLRIKQPDAAVALT
jgi:uncharacterized linocin/CFP29 family protein